jgi:hypothetical protein
MIEPGAVLTSGRTIAAVGEEVDADAKRRIDLGDATILPGFIDLHVHAWGANETLLIGGLTTVRDLGTSLAAVEPPRARPGALRVLHASPLLTVPGGYPIPVHGRGVGLPFRGPEGARKAVALVAERGAAVVKLALQPGIWAPWPMRRGPRPRPSSARRAAAASR